MSTADFQEFTKRHEAAEWVCSDTIIARYGSRGRKCNGCKRPIINASQYEDSEGDAFCITRDVTNTTNTRETERETERVCVCETICMSESEKFFVRKERKGRGIFSFSENGRLFSRELHSLVCSYLIGEQAWGDTARILTAIRRQRSAKVDKRKTKGVSVEWEREKEGEICNIAAPDYNHY